ncbi:hypothetical protein F7D09_1914 [Bifidobacterium leontopitheci]|uniref:Uncharacterized protein n=1 Tax=Bifidobacterium leontopitheci TaxID=2650774 RepID=A0A6I1GD63_9BIFI|nr:hypothetical protein F7D09_1914 [Bifidobacterium leontopitheci]
MFSTQARTKVRKTSGVIRPIPASCHPQSKQKRWLAHMQHFCQNLIDDAKNGSNPII